MSSYLSLTYSFPDDKKRSMVSAELRRERERACVNGNVVSLTHFAAAKGTNDGELLIYLLIVNTEMLSFLT